VLPAVAVLIVPGLHVPVIDGMFDELDGSTGGNEFWQIGPICVNDGVMLVATSMIMVTVEAHCPAAGAKV
jgi:hypothetical protein